MNAILLILLLVFVAHVHGVNHTDSKSASVTSEKSPETQSAKAKEKLSTKAPIPLKSSTVLLKGLKISITVPGPLEDYPYKAYTIFSDGQLHPFFRPCPDDSVANSSAGKNFEIRKCFRDSAYTDRLSLRFEYDEKALVKHSTVRLEAHNLVAQGGVTKPTIQKPGSRNLTVNKHAQSLTLLYNCIPGKKNSGTLSMVLNFRNKTNQPLSNWHGRKNVSADVRNMLF